VNINECRVTGFGFQSSVESRTHTKAMCNVCFIMTLKRFYSHSIKSSKMWI